MEMAYKKSRTIEKNSVNFQCMHFKCINSLGSYVLGKGYPYDFLQLEINSKYTRVFLYFVKVQNLINLCACIKTSFN